MRLDEVVRPHLPDLTPLREPHEAFIATDPDADGRVMVVVPGFDPDRRLGPCPVMPRGTAMPTRGCRALVQLSAEDSPWVLGWEPL